MSVASVSMTCLNTGGVTGNMISGAAQHHKRRPTVLRKTEAMSHAERANGKILDDIWRVGAVDSFQILPTSKHVKNYHRITTVKNQNECDNNNTCDKLKQTSSANCQDLIGSSELTQLLLPDRSNSSSTDVSNGPHSPSASTDYLPSTSLAIAARADKKDLLLPEPPREKESSDQQQPPTSPFLRLNIGGTFYLLLVDALLRADQSGFLAKFVHLSHSARIKVADGYLSQEDAYFFQRSPIAFEPIFQYYATGVIHKPNEICPSLLTAELEFWRIPATFIGACCAEDVTAREKQNTENEEQVNDQTFDKLACGNLRRRMWTFLERPGSSFQAKAFELSSTLFVAISVMGLSFATIPEFQVDETVHIDAKDNMPATSITVKTEHPAFIFTERICIAFFTVEYALRFFAAPRKLKFMFKPLNLVDLLAVLPFYLELILTMCGVDDRKLRDLRWAFLVVRILRVLRVIRIIKLGRFSSGLQTFGMTLKRSQKQLQMMTIVLLTGVVFFSTMIYFLEKDEQGTPFSSIPAAYWWCIVTMTTVGYGDVVPVTTMGKVIASAAIMSGVLVLALPITIIVDNFIKVAQDEQQAEQCKELEQRMMADKTLSQRKTAA